MSVNVFSRHMHFNTPNPPRLDDVILLTQVMLNKAQRNSYYIKSQYVKSYNNATPEFNIIFNRLSFNVINKYTNHTYETLFVPAEFIDHSEAFDTIYSFLQQEGYYVHAAVSTNMKNWNIKYRPIYYSRTLSNMHANKDTIYSIYKEYLFHLFDLEIVKLSKFICDELMPITMMRLDMREIYGDTFINKCALKSSGNNHISKELGITVSLYKKLIKNAIEEYVVNANNREAIKSSEFGSRFRIRNLYDINDNYIEIYFEETQTKGQKLIKEIFGDKAREDIVYVDKSRAASVVDVENIMPTNNSETMSDLIVGKLKYSKLAIDTACDVLYEILYIRRMLKRKKYLKGTSVKSYGEFKTNLLLELSTIENTKVGAPIFVFLDDETDYEMLKKAVTIATNPVLRHINSTDNPISLSFDYHEEAKTVVIGVIYNKEEE